MDKPSEERGSPSSASKDTGHFSSPGCGPMRLRSCPKAYLRETHRSRPPEFTLQSIEPLRRQLGVVSFGEATGADRLGIPVFVCDRIRPDGSHTHHTGKGISPAQAETSLWMEAIERHASEFRPEDREKLIFASYRDLKREYSPVHPGELILPAFSQFRDEWKIHWVWGTDLLNGEEVLVPACGVYHPFHEDPFPILATHTNGLASGNTLEEAVFHAVTEVIERDAWSIVKFNRQETDALTVEEEPGNGFLLDLTERFRAAQVWVAARDLTSDVGVPVIGAFSYDLLHPGMMVVEGFGAHLDPRVSFSRALLELGSTRAFLLGRYGLDGLGRTHSSYLAEGGDWEDRRLGEENRKFLGTLDSGFSPDIGSDVRTLLDRLRERGLSRVVAVDLTRREMGVPVVRVIVPGMEVFCFDRTRRGPRLYGG